MSTSSTAAPFEVPVPAQLVSFKPEKHAYVVHNARKKEATTMYNGNMMTVPPVHLVGPHSDTDADGDLIPGSYVIEDIFSDIPEIGDDILTFDSSKAVRHILGLQPGSDGNAAVATSPFALAGLSLLPRHAPKEQWKAIAAAGDKRAFLAEVEAARYTVAAHDESNAKRKAAEMPTISPSAEYRRATFLINKYEEMMEEETKAMLAPHEADQLEADAELEAIVHAKAMQLAEKVSTEHGVDKMTLLNQLLADPKVRILAQREWKIRKRGNMPLSAEELEAAAKEGEKVE